MFGCFLACFIVRRLAAVRSAQRGRPTSLKTGGAPTTISPVSAMFLRLRRKNIADTGEIVVRAPPVMKTCGPSPPQEVFRIQKKGLVAPLALSFPLICARMPAPHVALRR